MFVSEFVQYKSRGGKKVIKVLWHKSHFLYREPKKV